MSRTDDTTRDTRDATSPEARGARGQVRRMKISLTGTTFWQVLGHLLLDGTREIREAEPFTGVGFFSRPAAGANAECAMVFHGGSPNPIIVATRDEDLRKAVAKLDADQTAIFNRSTIVLCHSNGTVEIRSPSGTAHQLALKSDVDNLASFISTMHMPVVGGGGGTAGPPTGSVPTAAGTTVLKGQ